MPRALIGAVCRVMLVSGSTVPKTLEGVVDVRVGQGWIPEDANADPPSDEGDAGLGPPKEPPDTSWVITTSLECCSPVDEESGEEEA